MSFLTDSSNPDFELDSSTISERPVPPFCHATSGVFYSKTPYIFSSPILKSVRNIFLNKNYRNIIFNNIILIYLNNRIGIVIWNNSTHINLSLFTFKSQCETFDLDTFLKYDESCTPIKNAYTLIDKYINLSSELLEELMKVFGNKFINQNNYISIKKSEINEIISIYEKLESYFNNESIEHIDKIDYWIGEMNINTTVYNIMDIISNQPFDPFAEK